MLTSKAGTPDHKDDQVFKMIHIKGELYAPLYFIRRKDVKEKKSKN